MGDHILMKKLLRISIVSLLPIVLIAGVDTVKQTQSKEVNASTMKVIPVETPNHALINTKIQEIKPPRVGVKSTDVLKTKSPFLMYETGKNGKKRSYAVKKKVKLPPLKLESVINKNIKINGKWYKEGDRVRQYTIVSVSSGEVLLKSKKREIKLFQQQKNEKIKFNVN